jgi:transposase InsO family protein
MPTDTVCEPCLAGKQHRDPFPKQSSTRMTEPLSLVHSDLHGPLPVQTFSHCRYWISFIDDYSRFAHVFLLKKKSEALGAFKRYKALVENQLGCSIKVLRDDKGGEYVSHEFDQMTWEAGISRQRTAPGTPQQNGVAERFNRTAEERITAMLADAGLPLQFWGEAMNAYMEVHNVCPTSAVPDTTPHQRFLKVLPDISHFRRFGCPAFVHVPKKERKHLHSHTRKCIMLGYQPGTKAWRFWDPAQRKVIISRDAVFLEQQAQGGNVQDSVPAL